MRLLLALLATIAASAAPAKPPAHKLLVISVDGLDWRYLRDRDKLGLRIPNLRKLMARATVASGVVGVFPTITWPSHTSIITGVRPDEHGILGNQRPRREGGDYYWSPDLMRATPLWQCANTARLTTAAITWPVTRTDKIDWVLPEDFKRRNGGSMDLRTIASTATPGLVDAIRAAYPSFAQQWMDDRTRTQATLYLLREKRPDLLLLHLVDLDSEAHDQGPFELNANAIVERTDELIGDMIAALPPGYDLVVTSDHGFERVDRVVNLGVLMAARGLAGDVQPMGGLVIARDAIGAASLRTLASDPAHGIGREIPAAERARFAPALAAVAAWEPAAHVMFGPETTGPVETAPHERGNHGFWPLRTDYRSVFLIAGSGISAKTESEIDMLSIAPRLADVLGLKACVGTHR